VLLLDPFILSTPSKTYSLLAITIIDPYIKHRLV
jgi:hypothetical protein